MIFFCRPCLHSASPLPMWSSSICIVVASRRCLLMKIVSRTLIGGVPTHRMVKRSGRSFHSGCGICAKNSVNNGNLPQCVSPTFPPSRTEALPSPNPPVTGSSFGPPHSAHAARRGSLAGHDFLPHPDGTLRCRQGATLYPQERRPEHDGTLRVLYAARIADCRSCPMRTQCQGHGTSTKKPRRVSAVLYPLPNVAPEDPSPLCLSASASHPILWGAWSRCQPRRAWIGWQRSHLVILHVSPVSPPRSTSSSPLSPAQRAHVLLTWQHRLAPNPDPPTRPTPRVTII